MVDVDHRQRQRLPGGGRFGAGALQFVVERLAVGEIGQGVCGGVAADLLQVIAQPIHLRGGFLELLFQRQVLALHLAGRRGEGLDQRLQRRRHVGGRQFLGDVRQGLPIVARRLLGRRDGLGHRVKLLAELIPGVADLVVEARLGQERGRQLL